MVVISKMVVSMGERDGYEVITVDIFGSDGWLYCYSLYEWGRGELHGALGGQYVLYPREVDVYPEKMELRRVAGKYLGGLSVATISLRPGCSLWDMLVRLIREAEGDGER